MNGFVDCSGARDSRPNECGPGRLRTIRLLTLKKTHPEALPVLPAAELCSLFRRVGPLELKPVGGVAWALGKRPWRIRATYRRLKGTEQFLGFYDVHADCLSGLFRRRKTVREIAKPFIACGVAIQASGCGQGEQSVSTCIRCESHLCVTPSPGMPTLFNELAGGFLSFAEENSALFCATSG
jgi:hypothetical protein